MHPAEPIAASSDRPILDLDLDLDQTTGFEPCHCCLPSPSCSLKPLLITAQCGRTESLCLDIFTLVFCTRFSPETCFSTLSFPMHRTLSPCTNQRHQ